MPKSCSVAVIRNPTLSMNFVEFKRGSVRPAQMVTVLDVHPLVRLHLK